MYPFEEIGMSFVSTPLAPGASLTDGQRRATPAAEAPDAASQPPWWRVPMVWVVIAGPLAVVIASLLTAVIAWRHIDPVIIDSSSGQVIGHAGDDVAAPANPKDPLAPALRARNHSADARGSLEDSSRP